jgi:sporulation protein YlmC with PRC-barrel domain
MRGGVAMTMRDSKATLCKLSDSNLTVANPDEDIRGRSVVDRDGEEVGDVDDLIIDGQEAKVRFMRVASGGFLGLGQTKFMIPIDAVTRIADDTVHIDQVREHIAGAPRYDPDLVNDTTWTDPYWATTYGYYGYAPYWTPGYIYPPYPYYRY